MSPTATGQRPPATRPRHIDPRISARRSQVTRQQGRRRLHLLIALGVLAVLVVGIWFLLHSPLFSARAITVVGETHETAAQVESAAGLTTHPPLLDVHAGTVARRIETLPWVRSATVSVHWPDGVKIKVVDEVPAAVLHPSATSWVSVATDGRVLSTSSTRPAGLLLLSAPGAVGAPGTVLGAKDRGGLLVATTLPASFVAQVTGVTVEPGGWIQLSMTTPIAVDIGSTTQLSEKYEDVTAILAHDTLHNGDVIDVSVPKAPTVTPG